MQGHGSTCDCTFSVLLHIALCMCFAFFVCLPGGAFCFASQPQISVGSPFSVGDPVFPLSTVYGLPPSPRSRLFPPFLKRGPTAVSLLPKTIFLQVRLLFSTWHFFFCQSVEG